MKNYQEAVEAIQNISLGEGNWKTYLRIQSSFKGYSENNRMIILAQKPESTMVARFGYWKNLGRFVKKGESALRIFAPIIRKDETGKDELKGFTMVPVFDVSQTEGAPLPKIEFDLEKTSSEIIAGIENLTSTPIVFESGCTLSKSYLDSDLIIVPDRGSDMANVQNVIKGYVQYLCMKDELEEMCPEIAVEELREILAESVNFIVSSTFNFEGIEYDLHPNLLKNDSLLKKISPHISKYASTVIDMVYEGLGEKTEREELATA